MTSSLDLRTLAVLLKGEISGRAVSCPGPGHSRADRSLRVWPSFNSPDGFRTHSLAGDPIPTCRDYVKASLGLPQDGWRDRQGRPEIVYNIHDKPQPSPSSGQGAVATTPSGSGDQARTARALDMWNGGVDPRGTLVERYLASRGLLLVDAVAGHVIRFHSACPWRDGDRTIRVPCMISLMRNIITDAPQAIQRIRLTEEGQKVDRRMLGPAGGAAIKLDGDSEVTFGLHIAEGLESAMSARQFGLQPCWALGSAGAIAAFPVLAGIVALTILAEHDTTAARAVEQCATRWHRAGLEVTVVKSVCGSDLNDALRREVA